MGQFVFWFFSQREQSLAIRRKPEEQRMEARIPTRVGLELSVEPLIYEITFTENVSRHGARVVTKRRWSPNDSVLVAIHDDSGRRPRTVGTRWGSNKKLSA